MSVAFIEGGGKSLYLGNQCVKREGHITTNELHNNSHSTLYDNIFGSLIKARTLAILNLYINCCQLMAGFNKF